MADYEKKESEVLEKIAKTVEKLDTTLTELDNLDEDKNKKHGIKKWYEEKKAIHEIKHILHEVGKYAKYDEDEMKKIDKYFEDYNG